MTSLHADDAAPPVKMKAEDLHAWTDREEVIRGITLRIADRNVTALMGPSGCGKSPLLRCLDRMHEITPGHRVSGRVLLDGANIYAPGTNVAEVRRRVGMIFKKPNPFPHMSVRDNVLAGLRLNGLPVEGADELVERSLRRAALWDEVKGDLARPGTSLSRGQQQRLCIARALALGPEVLLLDEPTSALDPIATSRIEDVIHELRDHLAVVIVTHNMKQAARVSDYTAFIDEGELVEFDRTDRIFTNPRERRTEDYVSGKFG
ncbi:ATP-binding cassette domain-containing protein [Polyangium spumosum]|uniref:ATP-binding cassette domain-containing protein n=1 Tax=Polyangium spumosum TaxID=889282 RepID=A0A6N7PN32_9BACT|nr:ATP-binding cassette domain-containing protein [Polyangium spumosum]